MKNITRRRFVTVTASTAAGLALARTPASASGGGGGGGGGGRQVAESTLTAIMGREAAYTGQEITWDAILNAPQDLVPSDVQFGPMPARPEPAPAG